MTVLQIRFRRCETNTVTNSRLGQHAKEGVRIEIIIEVLAEISQICCDHSLAKDTISTSLVPKVGRA